MKEEFKDLRGRKQNWPENLQVRMQPFLSEIARVEQKQLGTLKRFAVLYTHVPSAGKL